MKTSVGAATSPRAELRRHFVASGIACLVLLSAGLVAAWSMAQATRVRNDAAAITDLQLATATVAAADALALAGGEVDETRLSGSIDRLSGDHHRALSVLSAEEYDEAEALLAGMADRGALLLSGTDMDRGVHGHERLDALLDMATARARALASAAETRSRLALGVAALAAVVVGWFLLRTRASDIRLRDDLRSQANTDLLTGVENRRALPAALAEAGDRMAGAGTWTGYVAFDLDDFKAINDQLGNAVGDELLRQVARRLDATRRSGDRLIRLGGDEFAMVLAGLPSPDEAAAAAARFLRHLSEPFPVGTRVEHLRVSLGVSTCDTVDRLEALVVEADLALQEAQRGGGGTMEVFRPSMETEATEVGQMVRALRAADYDAEFHLVYQPIVTIDQSRILGYEALLRWTSPLVGEPGPDRFIPIAEQSGEICSIGRWVLEQACRQLRSWIDADPDSDISISCNVSPIQLAQDDFFDVVVGTIDRWELPRSRLVIEVTESAVLDHRGAAIERLAALRAAGLRISIDDFGSGYSNLGQLLAVPFDVLKIDRSLLVRLTAMREAAGGDPQDPCSIMTAIVSIASVFNATVVCEGVETEQQRRSLEASGIANVQGWLTGRPVPPDQLGPPGSRLVAV
jgi:diguanylate cyclase (GGDEF)-like protein